jgi:hypothetical protein
VGGGGRQYWVLIETGANQAYIFDTNRLRHAVGASYLVRELGTTWVPAAAGSRGARVVLAISGKALLLVDDRATGRAVISHVSERALREAPGLDVTGVVGPAFDPAVNWLPAGDTDPAPGSPSPFTHVEALAGTYDVLDLARAARPSPHLRDPLLPWFEVCRDSGLPAAGNEDHADGEHAAAPVLAKSGQRRGARDRMRDLLADVAQVLPDNLDELRHDGWIAVIHADGNGVGQVFTDFARRAWHVTQGTGGASGGLSLEQHVKLLTVFASQLDLATETALGIAVRTATHGQDAADTIMPVVVGGDDLTVACHARFALGLTRAFALAFEEQTAAQPTLAAIIAAGNAEPADGVAPGHADSVPRLTAAAGIAYVKPHHPFSSAYALAEDLTASAKRFKQAGGHQVSALDLHIAFESTLADLADLRQHLAADGLPRHGGPYVITAQDSPAVGPRDIAELDRTMRTVSALSSSMAHDLREGLAAGPDEYSLRLRRAAQSADLPESVRPDDILHLQPCAEGDGTEGDGHERIVRLLDALLLNAIARPSPDPSQAPDETMGAVAGSEVPA